jgi:Sigma-70 region 2
MHAPLRQPDELQIHQTWRGGANGQHYFDSNYARQLIETYNLTGDQTALNDLLEHTEPLARSILEYRSTTRYEALDELMSRIRIKVWRSARLYDPGKGTAFSFIATIIKSISYSAVSDAWARSERFCELDQEHNSYPYTTNSTEAIAEIEYRVRSIKTPCIDPYELQAQRWFIESFIDCGFRIRRHEASDAVMQVFGLDHARSRQLFDLTMVAVRRELLPNRRLTLVTPFDLRGTKIQALIRYAKYLSSEEFTRLATLLRDVAPSVVFTVNPENTFAMRHGDWQAIRENLLLVLNGSPTDRRLFG